MGHELPLKLGCTSFFFVIQVERKNVLLDVSVINPSLALRPGFHQLMGFAAQNLCNFESLFFDNVQIRKGDFLAWSVRFVKKIPFFFSLKGKEQPESVEDLKKLKEDVTEMERRLQEMKGELPVQSNG